MSNTKLNDLAIGIKTRNNKHAPYMHLDKLCNFKIYAESIEIYGTHNWIITTRRKLYN